jgi:hypothetical protein
MSVSVYIHGDDVGVSWAALLLFMVHFGWAFWFLSRLG